ncbi:hypothetical protein AAG906_022501 [Vitis piasezkii]
MDTPTEKMENLRWARILVKTKRGELPSSIEIGIEETAYNLPLWWEVLPSIRQMKTEGRRGSTDRGEERKGDGGARWPASGGGGAGSRHRYDRRWDGGAIGRDGGLWESGNPSHSSLLSLGRTPEGEFFDHSGVLREACQNGSESNGQGAAGPREIGNVCWELVEFKGPISMARNRRGSSRLSSKKKGEGDRIGGK